MRHVLPLLLLVVGCATSPAPRLPAQRVAKGPWSEVPSVEMPTGDTSIPISLIRDVADALLKRPGAKVCDPVTLRPIVGLSTEYCSTIYVAGDRDSLSWRVTEPSQGNHSSCRPFFAVEDNDYPASQVWVVGYVHNHLCGAPPSSDDLARWPTDAFAPYVAMAEVRLIPGNRTTRLPRSTRTRVLRWPRPSWRSTRTARASSCATFPRARFNSGATRGPAGSPSVPVPHADATAAIAPSRRNAALNLCGC